MPRQISVQFDGLHDDISSATVWSPVDDDDGLGLACLFSITVVTSLWVGVADNAELGGLSETNKSWTFKIIVLLLKCHKLITIFFICILTIPFKKILWAYKLKTYERIFL